MMNLALMLLSFVGAANASEYFPYGFSICRDGTINACHPDHGHEHCENLCKDSGGMAEYFLVRLKVPSRSLGWMKRSGEALGMALQHNAEVVKPRLEAERKAEEDARKAKEKAEEDALKAKEKERKDCLAKMTYRVKVWACPYGDFVADPTACEKDTYGGSVAEQAVEVDLGLSILPPGGSCTGRTYWKDATHAEMLKHQLDKANDPCNSPRKRVPECSDEVKATALYLASEKALAKQILVIAMRRQTLPYDCLAGVCLNAPATRIADKLVTVSEVVMHRTVEVCAGRVVEISVSAGWIAPGYGGYVDILSGAEHTTYDGGWPSSRHAGQLQMEMEALGWKVHYGSEEFSTAGHPDKRGSRSIELGATDGGGRWWVALTTRHADKDALCAPKRQQGL